MTTSKVVFESSTDKAKETPISEWPRCPRCGGTGGVTFSDYSKGYCSWCGGLGKLSPELLARLQKEKEAQSK